MNPQKQSFRLQVWVVVTAVVLFSIKITAYFLTHSIAILTDALESIVNVAAGFIGLYSLYLASLPSDENHPYGHGKAEFLSAAIEGTLITVAGLAIIYKAIDGFLNPREIHKLDQGILLIVITAVINFVVGQLAVLSGKRNNSLALTSSGEHLKSDTYSTLGIIIGLALIYFTGIMWLDSAVALIFGFIIIYTGARIVRRSIAGIMDEADTKLLQQMIDTINRHRRDNWIDLHNLRVIKYGGQLHVDCHLTVPWYMNVYEAHVEVDELRKPIQQEFGNSIEFFVHSDGCLYFQCNICSKMDCPVRQHMFEKRIEWTISNVLSNKKHSLNSETTQDIIPEKKTQPVP